MLNNNCSKMIIVSAQSKELGFWVFQTWSDLRVRIWGLLGQQGIGDLDSGLTILMSCFKSSKSEVKFLVHFYDFESFLKHQIPHTFFLLLLLVKFVFVELFRTLENVRVSKCKVLYYTFSCRINLT